MIKPAVERRSSEALSTQLIDDGPVYHALSVHLRRAKLITHFDDRPIVAKFLKSRVWGKVQEETTLVLEVGYRHFLITQRGIGGRKPLCQNPAGFFRPFRYNARAVHESLLCKTGVPNRARIFHDWSDGCHTWTPLTAEPRGVQLRRRPRQLARRLRHVAQLQVLPVDLHTAMTRALLLRRQTQPPAA